MTRAPLGGVELLERALRYTHAALLDVDPSHLDRPTPCAEWSLDGLLDHMDDALDAFTEGAGGTVAPAAPRPETASVSRRVQTLQHKACALLGAWSGPRARDTVRVAGLEIPTEVLLHAAALEIAVHGWDVAQATGHRTPIPAPLAIRLTEVAPAVVADVDRGTRFARPVPPEWGPARHRSGGEASARLVGYLGRRPLEAGSRVSPVS